MCAAWSDKARTQIKMVVQYGGQILVQCRANPAYSSQTAQHRTQCQLFYGFLFLSMHGGTQVYGCICKCKCVCVSLNVWVHVCGK